MKFSISGADAVTGDDRNEVVEAKHQAAALAMAKGQGIFVSRIEALPEEVIPWPSPTAPQPVAPQPASITSEEIKLPALSAIFDFIAIVNFIVAVAGGIAIGKDNAFVGGWVFASGCLSGLFLLALSKVLDYLSESVQRLRQIVRHLDSKR
jgi:hypothetical protein